MTDVRQLLESRRSRLGRWGGAAVIVCALHVGGAALALMHWQEEDEDATGALTLEMAPLPAAVPVDSPEFLAHGPLTQDATQTSQAAEKVEERIVEDIPPVPPSPAPEPEIALPKPQPETKQEPEKLEDPKEEVVEQKSPTEASEQQVATAPPRVEAPPAPSPAPSPGQAASIARAQASWQKALLRQLERYSQGRYPATEERRGVKGRAVVRFRVDRSGQVVSAEIVESSGSAVLDNEALAILKRASPLPFPPDQVPEPMLENTVPLLFGMKPGR